MFLFDWDSWTHFVLVRHEGAISRPSTKMKNVPVDISRRLIGCILEFYFPSSGTSLMFIGVKPYCHRGRDPILTIYFYLYFIFQSKSCIKYSSSRLIIFSTPVSQVFYIGCPRQSYLSIFFADSFTLRLYSFWMVMIRISRYVDSDYYYYYLRLAVVNFVA